MNGDSYRLKATIEGKGWASCLKYSWARGPLLRWHLHKCDLWTTHRQNRLLHWCAAILSHNLATKEAHLSVSLFRVTMFDAYVIPVNRVLLGSRQEKLQ
jgi:hypothetical protein